MTGTVEAEETNEVPAAAAPNEALYAAHRKVYPRDVTGRFARLRVLSVLALLGLYYVMPWVRWDGRQAVLFDLPGRKFYVFGLTFFPQDFFLLTWLLVIAALSLFFFTALAGRLWCGYACPQTVWTEAFLWMERFAEGNRAKRMKLDRGPWTREKILRKTLKQVLWLSFAGFTGFTFVGFFEPIHALGQDLASLSPSGWEWFWVVFYGFATYGNAGFMREQVCMYMCPYARFQSAMFDRSTLIISYDAGRGEPRARGAGARRTGQGDCIDCTVCVQVCPTGIDIRKGLQYECIACAACIDACDAVMDKVGSPRGLIRYSTQAEMDGGKPHVLRLRTVLYGLGLTLLIGGFAVAVARRVPVNIDVLRDRNTLYRELDDGRVENVFTVRIINKDQKPHVFQVSALGLPDVSVDGDSPTHRVAAEEVRTVVVRVRVPEDLVHGGHDFTMVVRALDAPTVMAQSPARFFSEP
ncbi:MAG: cytochrome c oxidase accessory protein CcoG [Gammaproteobacteria bacterium]|nr:cytochrome c oxidase accessory protein CcoG [Gammaproteobacteria bacterium]